MEGFLPLLLLLLLALPGKGRKREFGEARLECQSGREREGGRRLREGFSKWAEEDRDQEREEGKKEKRMMASAHAKKDQPFSFLFISSSLKDAAVPIVCFFSLSLSFFSTVIPFVLPPFLDGPMDNLELFVRTPLHL